jgi:thymidylate kinase
MIISFEGVDGVGKSTLMHYASEYLRDKNIKVSCVSDGYTPDQNTKSELAKICQIFAKRFEVLHGIKDDTVTLYDRYIDSTYVYAPEECHHLIDILRYNIPNHYLCFLITCDPETILERIRQRADKRKHDAIKDIIEKRAGRWVLSDPDLALTLEDIEKTQDRFMKLYDRFIKLNDREDRIFVDNTNLDDAIAKITQHLDVLCTQIYL